MEYGWIVSLDGEIEAVLSNSALEVRPRAQRVPESMHGTLLGEIYGRMARWNDGGRHAELRRVVEGILTRWNDKDVERIARDAAARGEANEIAAYTVATLVGIREPEAALEWIRDFAAAVAAGANDAAIARGAAAAQSLAGALPPRGDADERANLLGFLFQSYAATARLIEIRLAGRTDAPVLLTRRYASEDVDICGTSIRKNDLVVVLLASQRFNFGAGPHACPGRDIAETIARVAVEALAQ
jgi:cytochrome P450